MRVPKHLSLAGCECGEDISDGFDRCKFYAAMLSVLIQISPPTLKVEKFSLLLHYHHVVVTYDAVVEMLAPERDLYHLSGMVANCVADSELTYFKMSHQKKLPNTTVSLTQLSLVGYLRNSVNKGNLHSLSSPANDCWCATTWFIDQC